MKRTQYMFQQNIYSKHSLWEWFFCRNITESQKKMQKKLPPFRRVALLFASAGHDVPVSQPMKLRSALRLDKGSGGRLRLALSASVYYRSRREVHSDTHVSKSGGVYLYTTASWLSLSDYFLELQTCDLCEWFAFILVFALKRVLFKIQITGWVWPLQK